MVYDLDPDLNIFTKAFYGNANFIFITKIMWAVTIVTMAMTEILKNDKAYQRFFSILITIYGRPSGVGVQTKIN